MTQILNFGLPAPIDVQVIGSKIKENRAYANKLLAKIARIPGVADARIQQAFNAPTFNVDVDRTRAELVGVTERDVAQNLQNTLAGSSQTAPTFWLNPEERRFLPDRRSDAAILGAIAVESGEHSRFPRVRQPDSRGRRLDQAHRQRRRRLALRGSTCYRHLRDQQ